ncbi:MAG TPA: hypothetical protein PKA64_18775, partial [Myxococcota bacterium]|nr:hypothetical protein [Myxococcota bacterium]
GAVRGAALGAMAWGVAALGYGLFAFDKAWTLGAVIVAVVYGLAVTQGAMMFAVILAGTQARWGRSLKRIAESIALALPFVYVLLLAFLFLGTDVYAWSPNTITGSVENGAFNHQQVSLAPHMTGVPHAKELWLSKPVFIGRLALSVGFMLVLDLIFLRASLRPDLMAMKKRTGAVGAGWWNLFIGGADDVNAAVAAGQRTQATLVPVLAITYALVMSFVAFDMIMSLDPWWVSNMFGGWTFMSSLWLALNVIGAFAMASRSWLGLGAWVKPATTHDLGRFILAGCMFWAYTLYAQILPIYYTNVPEETNFLLIRLMLPQWNPLSRVVAVLCFLAPFTILLSRGLKKMRWPFFGLNVLVMVGLFLERTLLVMPAVWAASTVPWAMVAFINLGLVAGVMGLIVLVSTSVIAKMPAVPVTDPFLEAHPWDVHVHSLDGHGAHH